MIWCFKNVLRLIRSRFFLESRLNALISENMNLNEAASQKIKEIRASTE